MKKKVAVVSVADAEEAARLADLPLEATVALAEVAGAIKDGLLAFASATGLVVMHQMMEAELPQAIGKKHARIPSPERVGNWHGMTPGSVVLGGRQVSTDRPRGRTTAGTGPDRDRRRPPSRVITKVASVAVTSSTDTGWLPSRSRRSSTRWAVA